MRAVIQRVSRGSVTVENEVVGQIEQGLVILLGVRHEDSEDDADYLAAKIPHLRIFEDENDKMNLSLFDVGGSILAISQFTLFANTRKGRRPSYIEAARPEQAEPLYEYFMGKLREQDIRVEKGIFGAMMMVDIVNEGPVTIIMDSQDRFEKRK